MDVPELSLFFIFSKIFYILRTWFLQCASFFKIIISAIFKGIVPIKQ